MTTQEQNEVVAQQPTFAAFDGEYSCGQIGISYRLWLIGQIAGGLDGCCMKTQTFANRVVDLADGIIQKLAEGNRQ